MTRLLAICILVMGISTAANADVWKWVDAYGKTHLVDTMKPIYTWVDEFEKVHYSDTPDHEDAVAVELLRVSSGPFNTGNGGGGKSQKSGPAQPGETDEQRALRETDNAYYCERATEALKSYMDAPQLYRTNDAGEREILTEEETAATIADTQKKKEEYCS